MKKQLEVIKDLEYYKQNCEENYISTPISVLRYISELENHINSQKEITVPKSEVEIEELAYKTLGETTSYGVKSAPLGSRDRSYYETEVIGFVKGYKAAKQEKQTLKQLCATDADLRNEVVEFACAVFNENYQTDMSFRKRAETLIAENI